MKPCTMPAADQSPDTVLTLLQAARRLGPGRGERPTHPATITRWILKGAKARDGRRLRLAALKLPGGWRVRPNDLDEFIEALTTDRLAAYDDGQPDAATPATTLRTPAQARRSHDQAAARLKAAGF